MRKWLPMLILASAQFVMVLDSSVMNVAISQIVKDLDTTIQGVQTAITLYTLVMAAFMLLGAKLGDIMGRNRAFAIGLTIYGIGSLTTALSPNLAVLLVGWSGVEGFGAVLVVPAIAALTAATYEGKDRALAYALLGGIAAVAVAAGPLIGGWVTTEFSWRYVFAAETVVVIVILFLRGRIAQAPSVERRPQLDIVGVALSSCGLGLAVFAILRSSVWGFVRPRAALTIGGTEITPLGFSVVPFMVLAGLALLWAFVMWEQRRTRLGRDALLDTALLGISQLRAGLSTLVGQQLVLMGAFFVIPVYLQVVLGLDAFETGKRLLPLSVAMLVFALLGPRIAARRSPRTVAQVGLVAVSIGALVMLGTLDVKLNETGFKVALALVGAGAGLLASQLGNIIMSAVGPTQTSEAGGLQGTAQNLGSSLGTAIIGAVLLGSLATGFSQRIADNPAVPAAARASIVANAEQGIDIVPVAAVESAGVEGGLAPEEARAVADDYGAAQLDALRLSLGAIALGGAVVALAHAAAADGVARRGGGSRRRAAAGGAGVISRLVGADQPFEQDRRVALGEPVEDEAVREDREPRAVAADQHVGVRGVGQDLGRALVVGAPGGRPRQQLGADLGAELGPQPLDGDLELHRADAGQHGHGVLGVLAPQDVDDALLVELLEAAAELLVAVDVAVGDGHEGLGRQGRNRGEAHRRTDEQRVAHAHVAADHHAHDVPGERLVEHGPVLAEHLVREAQGQAAPGARVVDPHPALEASGADADERHAVAVARVHVGLDLERERRERRVDRMQRAVGESRADAPTARARAGCPAAARCRSSTRPSRTAAGCTRRA